jgi:hypothetical protein
MNVIANWQLPIADLHKESGGNRLSKFGNRHLAIGNEYYALIDL